ncbi:MAG TPA: cytochrome C [Methylophilaceae bacterium]|nr:cytochrome C [Methylophilaceae bacterium]HAJ70460.1 cytochrome C [Methylophilaceae bacterium]
MNGLKLSAILLVLVVGVAGCGKKESASTSGDAAPAASATKAIEFVDTQESKPLVINAALFDTPAAKEFLATGKNPYIGNEEAIAKGKKVFQMYSCTQCHGPEAKGQVGPGLTGPTFRYPKDATNKGMFETVWHGTNGGMGAKGVGLMDPTDPKNGITPDELLKIIAWIRSMSNGLTGNE